jgi:hypothetical protein
MLKKVIEYTDFDGIKRKETCYFNLTKVEMMEMNLSFTGGLGKAIETATAEDDSNKIFLILKDVILAAYGERTQDGKFIKTAYLRESFSHSEIYSNLFFEVTSSAELATAFMKAVIPEGLVPN